MNPDTQGSGRPDGGDGKEESLHRGGSRKLARQRAKADLPPLSTGYGTRPLVISRPVNSPSPPTPGPTEIPRYPEPPHLAGQSSLPGGSIQRSPSEVRTAGWSPSTSPQWPQQWPQQGYPAGPQTANSPTQERSLGKGPPPQRPPRPSYVPPLFPPDSVAERFRLLQQQYQEPREPNSPTQESPSSAFIRPLSTSSGSIPDFPVHAVAPLNFQQRRILGPPPSARKGSSSYYPQKSLVTSIPEEISEAQASSSHVVSSGWDDSPPEHHVGERILEAQEPITISPSTDRRGSRIGDHDESTGLDGPTNSRKGRRKKRTSQPTGSGRFQSEEAFRAGDIHDPSRDGRRLHPKALTPGTRPRDTTIEMEPHPRGRTDERNATAASLFSPPPLPGNSPFPSPTSPLPDVPVMQAYPGPRGAVDPRVNQIMGHLEKGGAIPSNPTVSPQPSMTSSRSDRISKRPARLNLSRDGESRASQTSLPELIRRATRLAANLERARTASRTGLMDILSASAKSSRAGSISDILAAFPSPSIGTPPSARWHSSTRTKSSLVRDQPPPLPDSKKEGGTKKSKSRKCCGMPVWVFILLLGILVLLIAAAVVIPITLIVLPRTRNNPTNLASCKKKFLCGNGGTNVVVDKSCRCICANGFTGAACATGRDQSCIFTDIKVGESRTVYQNATVGDGIARLLAGAKANFSIPLDSTILLSRFSSNNLSCEAENLLVTFNQNSQRRSLPMQFVIPEFDLAEKSSFLIHPPLPQTTRPPSHPHHHLPRAAAADYGGAVTSNDIIFAASSTPPSDATPTPSRPTATGTSVKPSPTSSSPNDSSSQGIPAKVLDFARVAVLFVFQEKTLNVAIAANKRLQTVLADPKTWNSTTVVSIDTILVDFSKWIVDLGNGSIYGPG